jgi:hypothetical protein
LICRGAKEVDNSQVTEPLKEDILKGDVHTIEEMKAWLKPFGYSDAINAAAINFILREFVMSKVPSGSLCNAEMIEEHLRPLLKHQPSDFGHHTSNPYWFTKCISKSNLDIIKYKYEHNNQNTKYRSDKRC